MANRVTMSICGDEYTLVADESSAYMEKVGALVNGWQGIDQLSKTTHVNFDAKHLFPAGTVILHGIKTFEKERMFKKIKEMKDGTILELNKDDVCPIKCEFKKNDYGMWFKSVETGTVIVCARGVPGDSLIRWFVERIEKAIDEWDLVTKQYFIDLARKQGLDP